jgi:hypothetical protein
LKKIDLSTTANRNGISSGKNTRSGAMRFELGDRVRVVTCLSHFLGWTGTVVARFDGEFVEGVKHYQVRLDAPAFFPAPPLLFVEEALAFSE